MKINRFTFNSDKTLVLEDDIDFSKAVLDVNHIRKIESCHVIVSGKEYDDLLVLDLRINAKVIGVCSYSLEDVPLNLSFKDSLELSNEIEDDDAVIFEPNPIFEIDPYVLGLIVSEVPIKLVKKGAKLPENGSGYRVLSEDDYLKEQQEKKDDRWSKLDELELE